MIILLCEPKPQPAQKIAAKDAPKVAMDHIPSQYSKYSKIFSKTALHRLPQHQPWDHAIELKPGASMKNCSIYRLTPKESLALKEYIEEHLQKGPIQVAHG